MKILGNKESQAYSRQILQTYNSCTMLFYGPKGIGKRSFALELACENFDKHNIYYFSVEGKQCLHSISSANILLDNAASFPLTGGFSCFIFDEADRMGFNVVSRLLKITEEPNRRLVVILVSNKPQFIPKTLMSRSIKVPFFKLSKGEVRSIIDVMKLKSEIDEELFDMGSVGKILAFNNLKQRNGDQICKKLTDFPLSLTKFTEAIYELDLFHKELVKLESDLRLSIHEIFWELLLICFVKNYKKGEVRMSKIAHKICENIEGVSRGISVSSCVEQIWIDLKLIDVFGC